MLPRCHVLVDGNGRCSLINSGVVPRCHMDSLPALQCSDHRAQEFQNSLSWTFLSHFFTPSNAFLLFVLSHVFSINHASTTPPKGYMHGDCLKPCDVSDCASINSQGTTTPSCVATTSASPLPWLGWCRPQTLTAPHGRSS